MAHDEIQLADMTPNIKGVTTIQLFSDNGDLVNEVKQTNYVSQSVLDVYSQVYKYGLFSLIPSGLGSNYFNGLVLTDFNQPTNPSTERYLRGNVLGIGVRNVAGTGDYRGTFNTIESISAVNYEKMVIDFATSQANGTFQSIYTGKLYNNATKIILFNNNSVEYNFMSFNTLYKKMPPHTKTFDGYLYVFGDNNTYIDVYNLSSISNLNIEDYGIRVEIGKQIVGLTKAGDHIYLLTSVGEVLRANSTDLSSLTSVHQFTRENIGQNYGAVNSAPIIIATFAYDKFNNQFILLRAMASTPNTTSGLYYEVVRLNSSFVVQSAVRVTNTTISAILEFSRVDKDIIINGTEIIEGVTFEKIYNNYSSDTANRAGNNLELNSKVKLSAPTSINGTSYGLIIGVAPCADFLSRVLLDSPVTKTAQHTMKIIYEFTMPELSLM